MALYLVVTMPFSTPTGTPRPNVTWWQGDRLLDDTWESGGYDDDGGGGGGGGGEVQNILEVERLTRDYHNTTLTCAATNTRLVGPVTTRVVVKMYCEYIWFLW